MKDLDVAVIGAGAAGLFCAAQAGQRGLRVLLIDHAEKLAEKIRISGGGRCNFTNLGTSPANFLSENPHFCRSALARYTPNDFVNLVRKHGIAFHEKHKGQLFCDQSAEQIIQMLLSECGAGGVERWQPCGVMDLRREGEGWALDTDRGPVHTRRVVVATGGLSIPKIGASDFGLQVAARFGHTVVPPRPALVPLTFDPVTWAPFLPLAGMALPVRISTQSPPAQGGKARRGVSASSVSFDEDLLFTHRGLSGPAVLQTSSYWTPGNPLRIDLLPEAALGTLLGRAKLHSRRQLNNELGQHFTQRFADTWLDLQGAVPQMPMAEVADTTLKRLAESLQAWELKPQGTEGWRKAEVMAGGVDTRELQSSSLESKLHPGLHFIGEVVDVTGWLGGYNFQWAWASAWACAEKMAETPA